MVPVIFPCIECCDIDTPELRARLAAELPRTRWLAFTSRRGVAAFVNLRGGAGPGPGRSSNPGRAPSPAPIPAAVPDGVRVAAVGPATARAAAGTFGRVDLAGGAGGAGGGTGTGTGTAAALADALVPLLGTGDRVLAAVAENAGRAFEETIRAAGHACTRLDVYRTRPVPARVRKRPVSALGADDVLLASPSAVAGFVNQVRLDTAPVSSPSARPRRRRRAPRGSR